MDLLQPLLILVVIISGGACFLMVRRRLWGDAPMIVISAVVALMAFGGVMIAGPVGTFLGVVALLLGFVLETIPTLLEPLTHLALIQGHRGRAVGLGGVYYLLRPTFKRWTALRVSLVVWRLGTGRLTGPDALKDLQKRLERLGSLRNAKNAAAVDELESLVIEGMTAVRAVRRHWVELSAVYDRQPERFKGYFAHKPTGAAVDVVRALCETGRLDDAAQVVGDMNLADEDAERSDDERSDAFHNKARVVLLAWLGRTEVVEAALDWGSALRGLFTAQERADLQARAAAAPRATGALVDAIALETASALKTEARLATSLSSLFSPTPATLGLLTALGAIYVMEVATGSSFDPVHLSEIGGHLRSAVFEGQWWRIITGTFLHAGIVHLGLNALFLLLFGNLLERLLGAWRFLLIYLVAGIVGAIAAVLLGADRVGVGASGAIFGIFGACFPALIRVRRKVPGRWFFRQMAMLIGVLVLNTYLGLALEFVSFSAHTGGLIAGFVAALLLFAFEKQLRERINPLGIGLTTTLWAICLSYGAIGLALELSRPISARPLRVEVLTGHIGADASTISKGRVRMARPASWLKDLRHEEARPWDWSSFHGAQGRLFPPRVHCPQALPSLPDGDALAVISPRDSAALHKLAPKGCELGPSGFVLCESIGAKDAILSAVRLEERGLVRIALRVAPIDLDEGRALRDKLLPSIRVLSCSISDEAVPQVDGSVF